MPFFVSYLVCCAANWSNLSAVGKESSTMKQFTSAEIWKQRDVLIDIYESRVSVCQSEDSSEDSKSVVRVKQ